MDTTRNGFRIKRSLRTTAVGLACVFVAYGQVQVQISGHIADQVSAAPIPGLPIFAVQPPSVATPQPKIYRTTSASDGSYSVTVPPGSYRICLDEAEGYLDPCQWALGSTDISATTSTSRNIALQKGRSLIVRISDPGGVLAMTPSATATGPAVSVSISDGSSKTRLLPFRRTAGAVHEFSLLVPLASYTLHVASSAATLAAPDGSALTAGGYNATVNVAAPPATPPSWLPIWLADRAARGSTIVALKVVAAGAH
jgi:hypothetical protein